MVSDDNSQDVSQPEVSTPEQPQMKQTDSVDEGPMIKMDVPETQNVLKQNRSLGSRLSNIKSCNKTRSEFKNRVRFRKSHDRGMFKILNEICKEKNLDITEFRNSKIVNRKEYVDVILQVSDIVGWKDTPAHLLTRIQKILSESYLSVRETKLLKRLFRDQKKNDKICFNELLYYFPGKTVEILEEALES